MDAIDTYTHLVDIGEQPPRLGCDPDDPILPGIEWMFLTEIPERDRAFLCHAGLLTVPSFLEEIERWGDAISYPD